MCNLAVIASRSCYGVNLSGCYMFNMLINNGIRVQMVCMDLTKDPVLCAAINDMWAARLRETVRYRISCWNSSRTEPFTYPFPHAQGTMQETIPFTQFLYLDAYFIARVSCDMHTPILYSLKPLKAYLLTISSAQTSSLASSFLIVKHMEELR